jgi:hypothetical protein
MPTDLGGLGGEERSAAPPEPAPTGPESGSGTRSDARSPTRTPGGNLLRQIPDPGDPEHHGSLAHSDGRLGQMAVAIPVEPVAANVPGPSEQVVDRGFPGRWQPCLRSRPDHRLKHAPRSGDRRGGGQYLQRCSDGVASAADPFQLVSPDLTAARTRRRCPCSHPAAHFNFPKIRSISTSLHVTASSALTSGDPLPILAR